MSQCVDPSPSVALRVSPGFLLWAELLGAVFRVSRRATCARRASSERRALGYQLRLGLLGGQRAPHLLWKRLVLRFLQCAGTCHWGFPYGYMDASVDVNKWVYIRTTETLNAEPRAVSTSNTLLLVITIVKRALREGLSKVKPPLTVPPGATHPAHRRLRFPIWNRS